VDVNGHLLRSFTDVEGPRHLSVADDDNVLVADRWDHCVMLLGTQLQLQRVLIDKNNPQLKLWSPTRLCYSPVTSMLHVAHSSSEWWSSSDRITLFRLTHDCSNVTGGFELV